MSSVLTHLLHCLLRAVFFSVCCRESSDPLFETAIRVEASLSTDRALMFQIYHTTAGAEISAEDALGAGTTSMHELIKATETTPITLQIVREETVLDGASITAFVKKI